MSFANLVIYKGKPQDPEAFLKYYLEHHVPLVWAFPRIRKIEVERGIDDSDIFLIARLIFDSLEDLRAAMTSEARDRARRDMQNFPPFEGTVLRQVVEILEPSRG